MIRKAPQDAEIARIEGVAWDVRRQFEEGSVYTWDLMEKYLAYTLTHQVPNELARAVFLEARASFPVGNCGIASVALQDKLDIGELIKGSYGTQDGRREGHSFLLIGGLKGVVVDITSDQFGGPKIYVGRLKEPWSAEE